MKSGEKHRTQKHKVNAAAETRKRQMEYANQSMVMHSLHAGKFSVETLNRLLVVSFTESIQAKD